MPRSIAAAPDGTIWDPSRNVLDLVDAAVRRLDDIGALRAQLSNEQAGSLRREMDLRDDFKRRFGEAEARRIDALRDLDRLEVKTANDRHQLAVDTLAKATTAMADTLRSGAETIARTLAAQQETYRKEIELRLGAVEKWQAAGAGKGAGLNAAWIYLGGLVALLAGLWGLGSKFFGH